MAAIANQIRVRSNDIKILDLMDSDKKIEDYYIEVNEILFRRSNQTTLQDNLLKMRSGYRTSK